MSDYRAVGENQSFDRVVVHVRVPVLHDDLVGLVETQHHVVARTPQGERGRRDACTQLQRVGVSRGAIAVVDDGVGAIAEIEHVGVRGAVAGQEVVAGAALERSRTADGVRARAAEQDVRTRAIREYVIAVTTCQRVVARIALQVVVARASDQQIDAITAAQRVVTRSAVQRVIAAVAADRVIAGATLDELDAVPPVDGVIARCTVVRCKRHRLQLRMCEHRAVGEGEALDRVVVHIREPVLHHDLVGRTEAKDHVIAGTRQ